MNYKGCEKKQSWLNVRYYFSNFLDELIKTNKNLGQDQNTKYKKYTSQMQIRSVNSRDLLCPVAVITTEIQK
jgi:hypothetical protein